MDTKARHDILLAVQPCPWKLVDLTAHRPAPLCHVAETHDPYCCRRDVMNDMVISPSFQDNPTACWEVLLLLVCQSLCIKRALLQDPKVLASCGYAAGEGINLILHEY